MSLIRKIIGFVPVVLPAFFALYIMSPMPATSEIYRTPLYRPFDVPLFIWLWLAAALTAGILFCNRKLIPFGIVVGALPYIALLMIPEAIYLRHLTVYGLLFYIIYTIFYYTYHREKNKP